MYEEPIIADNLENTTLAMEDSDLDTEVNANDLTSQDINKSKLEEDEQKKLHSNKLILRWGLVFTFFR